MSKRIFQVAVALVAMTFLVLAPIACQQAEEAADSTETAKPAANPSGKKLMAAKPGTEKAVEEAAGAVDESAQAVEEVIEEGEAAAEEATGEAAEGEAAEGEAE